VSPAAVGRNFARKRVREPMPETPQRVILKPPDAPPDRLERLRDALCDAIATQNRLAAKSPYILRFVGALEEDEHAFTAAHESAAPLNVAELFDPSKAAAPVEELLRATSALADALAVAHAPAGGRPVVHGGLCPGTILLAPDGLLKVTDFGFAPAVCKSFGVDSYLNLAVGPPAEPTPDTGGGRYTPKGSGVWEVLSGDILDRDDRLCAFVDPDKYGTEALTSFEPGSDVVAAGLIVYLLAEHKHPYLYSEPQAHRVVDMARMMGFGVPYVLIRKDLRESTNPAVRAWRDTLAAMLSRLPAERPSAAQLVEKLGAAAPQAELDELKAERWLTQLEALLAGKAWSDLAVLIEDRPALKKWPIELLSRAKAVEIRVREGLADAGREAAAQRAAELAAKWFNRVQAAVRAADWNAAQDLLREKPQVDHWPEGVLESLEPLTKQIAQAGAERKARAWLKVLQNACEAQNWSGIDKLLAQRPSLAPWPDDLRAEVAVVEAAYSQHLTEEQQKQRLVQEQHALVQSWLQQAKAAAQNAQWEATLDLLAQPPTAEHWPPGGRVEATQLAQTCRQRLGESIADRLTALDENIGQLARALVEDVVAERFGRLLRKERIEIRTELVVWHSETPGADGHVRILVRLRPPAGQAEEEPLRGELDFQIQDEVVHLCGRQAELTQAVADGLGERLTRLQRSQIGALEGQLRAGLFSQAIVRARIERLQADATAQVLLLGENAEVGALRVEVKWDDDGLVWAAVDMPGFVAQALKLARTTTQRVVFAELLAGSATLRAYQPRLALELEGGAPAPTELPQSLSIRGRLVLTTGGPAAGGEPAVLHAGTVECKQVGRGTFDASPPEVEARLRTVIVELQQRSREALTERIQTLVQAAPTRTKLSAPKRSRTPVDEIAFEIKPKSGNAIALRAVWSAAALAYELPAGAENTIERALRPAPTPAAEPKPPPQPARVEQPAAPAATGKPAPAPTPRVPAVPVPRREVAPAPSGPGATRPPKSRRGLVLGGVLACVALVIVVGSVVVLRGRGTSAPPPVAGTSAEQVPPVAGPSAEQAPPVAVTPPVKVEPNEAPPPVAGPSAEPVPPIAEKPPPKVEPNEARPPVVEAPKVDLVQNLKDYFAAHGDQFGPRAPLDKLLPQLIPGAEWQQAAGHAVDNARFLAAVATPGTVTLDAWQLGEGEQVSFDLRTELKGGAEPAKGAFSLRHTAEGWNPVAANVESLTQLAGTARKSLLAVVQAAREEVGAKRRGGDLKGVYAGVAPLSDVLPALSSEDTVKQLNTLLKSVPPPWEQKQTELAGYVADGELDPHTGYPGRLKDAQGHTLLLVSVAPGDALWAQITGPGQEAGILSVERGMNADERPWHLFYVDARELAEANDFTAAEAEAKQVKRALPTRDEWVLAALKLRGGPTTDLHGGRRDWCASGGADSTPWVCGAVTQKLRGREVILPPPPKNPDKLDEMWAWLNNPLVIQKRSARLGDDLAGVRSVLRIQ